MREVAQVVVQFLQRCECLVDHYVVPLLAELEEHVRELIAPEKECQLELLFLVFVFEQLVLEIGLYDVALLVGLEGVKFRGHLVPQLIVDKPLASLGHLLDQLRSVVLLRDDDPAVAEEALICGEFIEDIGPQAEEQVARLDFLVVYLLSNLPKLLQADDLLLADDHRLGLLVQGLDISFVLVVAQSDIVGANAYEPEIFVGFVEVLSAAEVVHVEGPGVLVGDFVFGLLDIGVDEQFDDLVVEILDLLAIQRDLVAGPDALELVVVYEGSDLGDGALEGEADFDSDAIEVS